MYNIDSYLTDLKGEVEKIMSEEKLTPEQAFTKYIMDAIYEKTSVDERRTVHCEIKDKAKRVMGEIYGYGFNANKEVLTLYYSAYESTMKVSDTLHKKDFDTSLNRLQGFYNECFHGNYVDLDEDSPEYQTMKYIHDNLPTVATVRLCLLSNFYIKDYKNIRKRIDDKNVFTDIWDIEKICANLSSESDHVSIDIDFVEEPRYSMYSLPYIEMNSGRYGYKCLATMFPAKLLYKLYEDFNTALLMSNVRYFLGFSQKKEDTNSGMRKTLKESNEMFLAYNNGITAIARKIEVDGKNDQTRLENEVGSVDDFISTGILRKIYDFQIVNGGQTTATIFNAKKTDKKEVNLLGVYVMVKLIVIDETKHDEITNISKFSNTQNKVKYADFSSNNNFNRAMENLSRSILIPNENNDPIYWYYERVRGQYKIELNKRTNKAGQDSFRKMFHSDKKFDKEIVAKLWVSWYESPHEAVKGSSTTYAYFLGNIVDKGKYAPDETYYKHTIALLIIYRFMLKYGKNAEFSNATAPVAAYALAYLNHVTLGNLDLRRIWQNQGLPDELKDFICHLCDKVKEELDFYAVAARKNVLGISKTKDIYPNIRKKNLDCDIENIRQYFVDA